jgi:integrase
VAGFRNEKHQYQWRATLTKDAAALRPMLLNEIKTDDVRKVLEAVWLTKFETARRLRQRIERVLDAAKAAGLREGENPARWKGNLQPFFGSQRRAKKHHPAVPYADMPKFMTELRTRRSISALALEFTILTCARTTEVRLARISEIDLDAKLWTIPAERMKAQRLHRVPLPDRAIEIVKSLKRKKDDLLFCAPSKEPLSIAAMLECLRNLRSDVTVHGFRSSFRDWVGDETNFPREIAEAALAHTIEDEVEAAYRRSDALKRRRELMALWERFLAGELAQVVDLAEHRKAS